jgi:molybdopterin-guanine dinucleotide biosynthesis protein A
MLHHLRYKSPTNLGNGRHMSAKAETTGPAENVLGIVLAGGASSRMGQDKTDMLWHGQTLLQHACKLLDDIGCPSVCVLGRPDLENGLADINPGAGPGQALLQALEQARDKSLRGILALPADMPRLNADVLSPLLSLPDNTAGAWARHPLPLFLPATVSPTDPASIRAIRDLLNAGPVERPQLPASLEGHMLNVNTPEDFAALD